MIKKETETLLLKNESEKEIFYSQRIIAKRQKRSF